ncbi:MAG: hypothetical protein Q8876_07320 [Bacillota bacterium]|nr:hypothetical protein [Bacillota bacterium]
MKKDKQIQCRATADTVALLELLQGQFGLSQSDIIACSLKVVEKIMNDFLTIKDHDLNKQKWLYELYKMME